MKIKDNFLYIQYLVTGYIFLNYCIIDTYFCGIPIDTAIVVKAL